MNIYFAENIKKFRKERKLTQEALAEYLDVSFQTVSKWERGEGYPDITTLPVISTFFGVTLDELFGVNRAETEVKLVSIKLVQKEFIHFMIIFRITVIMTEFVSAQPGT